MASSWSNAQRRDTISQPASLPIANASTPPRSFSRAFTARFVGSSMNGLPRKPGCARPRCPRDRLAQADRHIAEASPELCPQCRATKITRGICIIPLPIAERVMPIAQFFDSSEFDPETKRVMAVAFEMARAALQLGDQSILWERIRQASVSEPARRVLIDLDLDEHVATSSSWTICWFTKPLECEVDRKRRALRWSRSHHSAARTTSGAGACRMTPSRGSRASFHGARCSARVVSA